ncbi:D-serine dehydratase [Rhypophila decipiens]
MTTLKDHLKAKLVGQTLQQVPSPCAVLDRAKLEVNCQRMLDATARLGLLWRAHIKTHKTTELTRLQVGDDRTTPVALLTSTVLEAENIAPLLQEYKSQGRDVNVLLGFPLFPSSIPRLSQVSSQLGKGGLSVMIDHPDQLKSAAALRQSSGHPPLVFIKIDAGYGRAGVVPKSPAYTELIDAVLAAEQAGSCKLHGLYCHAGHSYGLREDWEAMKYLAAEFAELTAAAALVRSKIPHHELVLSVGATPTTTAIQNPSFTAQDLESADETTREIITLFKQAKEARHKLEVHAGVYPTLDIQQLSTHARDSSLLTANDIAISVIAEVASVYPTRGKNNTPEALICAGTLALGREPVSDKGSPPGVDYSSWGYVMPWGSPSLQSKQPLPGPEFPRVHGGWQVGRISQEHGILTWNGPSSAPSDEKEEEIPELKVGDKVRIWPNHACVAGAAFDYYLVVDSRNNNNSKEDEVVVDVWPRWRGW